MFSQQLTANNQSFCMKNNIIKCFSLEGVLVDSWAVEKDVVIKARSPRTHAYCPKCAESTKKVHDFCYRKILHDMLDGKRVILNLLVRRFKCSCHAKPFTEWHPPGITRKRYSERFAGSVVRQLSTSNFLETAKRHHISIPTVLAIARERQKDIPLPEGEMILNIDEHSYRGRDMKTTVGASNHHKMLAILKDDRQSTLTAYLNSWPSEARDRVKEVCIDMKTSYLYAIEKVLPHANIVVDHFHVVKEMNRQVDDMRRLLQQTGMMSKLKINRFLLVKGKERLTPQEKRRLEVIFESYKRYPTLKQAYFVKEKVREMYQCKTKTEALRKLDMLLSQLESYEVGKLREMRDTLMRWKPYILNFFERRTTNAFIEGCHNKIKLVKRLSYGFRNLENYILRITLAFAPFLFTHFHTNV